MSGKVGDLSPKQAAILKQFKENLQDVLQPQHTDHYLLRWLRARCFDVKKSEKMFRDNLQWRKRAEVDRILMEWEPPEVLVKYYPGGILAMDKDGQPVLVDLCGRSDMKGLIYSARKSDIIKYKVYCQERTVELMKEQSRKCNRTIDTVSLVFDMEGIGMRHLWKPAVDVFCETSSLFEANYPEMLKQVYIINVPKIFPIAYNLVKHFLSEETKKKICLLGSCWKEKLLEIIEPDQLPVHWGGTKRDPDGDPCCRSTVCMGGEVPHHYYKEKTVDLDLSKFTTVTVNRGSSVQLDFHVVVTGCILRWHFWTEGNDIGFGVFRRTSAERQKVGEMEDLVSSSRVNSHLIAEQGSVCCDVLGTYVIRFDNTYSWVKCKKVLHHIDVLRPDASHQLPSSGTPSPTNGSGPTVPTNDLRNISFLQ